MGRHGGGSRSGGGGCYESDGDSGARHGGGSRSDDGRERSGGGGGSRIKTTAAPFKGCYDRSYYVNGTSHSYYTNNKNYGISKLRIAGQLTYLILLGGFIFFFLAFVLFNIVQKGEKVNGNPNRIVIQDTIDLLSDEEELKTLELFEQVYLKSGMPITLYTDDMEWQDQYDSIEIYSEELYYAMGIEEDAMIILFTYDGEFDWVYDMYCGDDTERCLSYETFSKLIENFQKGMAGQKLYHALDYSLNSIMDELAKTRIDTMLIFVGVITGAIFGGCYAYLLSAYRKERNAYKYFKENPDKVNNVPMLVKYQCPSCGAPNSNFKEVCEYCGTVLKLD